VGISQFSGSWGRDGVILYGLGSTIFRVSEAGGDAQPQQFEGIPANHENRFPSFLPDGRRFFFLTREPGGPSTAYVASVDGGPATRLFAADSQVVYTEPSPGRGHVLFVRDGNLMAQRFNPTSLAASGPPGIVARSVPLYAAEFVGTGRGAFSASRDGILVYNSQTEGMQQRLVWLDRAGRELGGVGEPALYFGPRISPEGRRIAVSRLDPITRLGDIYVLDESGGSLRLSFDAANDLQPVWTPDGQFVIWGSQRREKSQLVRKRADGSGEEERLHESDYPLGPDDVSPDGRFLVFRESRQETTNDLWLLPLDGSGSARPLLNTAADEPRARFSPDGRFIGYISNASGRMEAYIQPFPQMSGKWQLSDGSGAVPQWRADGREIYVTTRGGIVARSVLGTDPLRLGEPVPLFTPPLTPRGSFFHVSADGQRFLFATERLTADARRFHLAIDWVP
jgi:eukaryotic-like serine/threonine-protein kinase